MGTTIFWILFWLFIVTLIVSNAVHERNRIAGIKDRIRGSFGRSDDSFYPTDRFDKIPALFDRLISEDEDMFFIDDITVNDLGIRDIYSRVNSCVTCAGSDYLYCAFRIASSCSYDDIIRFADDSKRAVELAFILERHRIKSDEDGFVLLKKLADAKKGSLAVDIAMPVLLAASLLLTVFYPVAGIVSFIILVMISISLYFSGKRNMDDNLKGFALAARMIGCAAKLCEAGHEGLSRYGDLEFIRRGNFLISFRDQSSSDPLSVIFDYVRMITHIDLIVYKMKISGISEHTDELLDLYTDIGKLDACIALASYISTRQHCRADISDSCIIKAHDIYHPLIKAPVKNDLTAERGILITGSNASGKSTFLKAVGLNVIFAENFGFAFASSFTTHAFRVFTSMALTDNILGGESYYMVEARSIKRICDAASSGDCLAIIDEVLRGTNTVERIAASSKILASLTGPSVICLAATHDLELTALLEKDMDMYYFTEEITDDDVKFPYRIYSGVSDRTNAIRLLDMLGFDRSIVTDAGSLAEGFKKTGRWVNNR